MGIFGKRSNRVGPDVDQEEGLFLPRVRGSLSRQLCGRYRKKKKTAFWKKLCNGSEVIEPESQTKKRDFLEELYETRIAIVKEREIAVDKREKSNEVIMKLLIEREKSLKDKEREFCKAERRSLAKGKNKGVQVDVGLHSVPDINKNYLDETIPRIGRLLPPLHLAAEKMKTEKKKGKKKSKKVKTEKDIGEKINTTSSCNVKQDVKEKEKQMIKVQEQERKERTKSEAKSEKHAAKIHNLRSDSETDDTDLIASQTLKEPGKVHVKAVCDKEVQGKQPIIEEEKGKKGRNTNVKPKAVAEVETPSAKIQATSDSEEVKGKNGDNRNVKPKAVAEIGTPAAKIQATSDSDTDDDDLIVCKRLKWPAKDYINVADENKPSTGTDDRVNKVKKCNEQEITLVKDEQGNGAEDIKKCSEQGKSIEEDNDEQGDGDTAKAETIADQNNIYDQIKEILSKLINDGKSIKQILTSGGDTSNNNQVLAHTGNIMAYFEDVSPLIEQIQEENVYDRTDSLFEVIYLKTEDITLKSNALAKVQNWNGQNCTSLLSQIENASDIIIDTGTKIARLLVPVDY